MSTRINNVVPDKMDIRDRLYQPSVTTAPRRTFMQHLQLPI